MARTAPAAPVRPLIHAATSAASLCAPSAATVSAAGSFSRLYKSRSSRRTLLPRMRINPAAVFSALFARHGLGEGVAQADRAIEQQPVSCRGIVKTVIALPLEL